MFMRMIVLFYCIFAPTAWGSAFVGNKIDDMFIVKSIAENTAITEGVVKGLKEGDSLYFARSPFKFTVTEVKGNQVKVALPETHSLDVGQSLMRNITAIAKKGLETESRLKQALED